MCMPAIAESDWPVGSVVPLLFVPEGELVLLRVEVPVVDLTVVKVVGVGRVVVVVRAVVDGRTLVTVVFPEGVGTADVVAPANVRQSVSMHMTCKGMRGGNVPAPHAVAERAVKVDSSAGQLFTRQAVTASVKTWLLQTQVRSALEGDNRGSMSGNIGGGGGGSLACVPSHPIEHCIDEENKLTYRMQRRQRPLRCSQ